MWEYVWVGEVEVGGEEGALGDKSGEAADYALFHDAGVRDAAVAKELDAVFQVCLCDFVAPSKILEECE